MPTHVFNMLGDGYEDLSVAGSPISILEVETRLVTPGNIDFRSLGDPKRIMHGGWFAFGYSDTSPGVNNFPMWHAYLEFDQQNHRVAKGEAGNVLTCNGCFWSMPDPVVEWNVIVYY